MNPSPQTSIAAASDSYTNRSQDQVADRTEVTLGGEKYSIFGYKSDPVTGFHATAYQNAAPPHNVIIAYRGTDVGHFLTGVQDAAVDATMVRDRVNPQKDEADAFTREMINKAQARGVSRNEITVAGHSLGGTLAEIQAYEFKLHGATLNAYGAVGLGYGVPEGGTQMKDYVMAGDVVSAGNHHFGQVITLASPEDIQSLRNGRYLDAPVGSLPPNPLVAMRLGDHSVTLGAPERGSRTTSVLDPKLMGQYEQNYARNKAAVDHFRGDVYRERGELAQALHEAKDPHNAQMAHLPSDMQRQLGEYLTLNVDPSIQRLVEQNKLVFRAEFGLSQSTNLLQRGGNYVQAREGQFAHAAREAGKFVAPVSPLAPLLGAAFGEGVHLHGTVVKSSVDFVSAQLNATEKFVERGAHSVTQAVDAKVHSPEVQARVVHAMNSLVDTYHDAELAGHNAEQAWSSAKQAVSNRVDRMEHNASQAYETLKHPGQWFHSDSPSASKQTHSTVTSPPKQSHAITPADSGYGSNDPRHRENPHHELYQQLKARVPDASENRLLQFTDACNAKGISDRNLGEIAFDRQGGHMIFRSSSVGPMATVDVKEPSPQSAQSMQHIQQVDQTQAQIQSLIQAWNAQVNQQQSQAPMQGQGF